MSPLINLKNFVANSWDGKILSCASFSQDKGERVCIYGPSSSGKSILHKFIKGRRFEGIEYNYDDFYLEDELSIGYYDYNTPFNKTSTDIKKSHELFLVDEPEKGFSADGFEKALGDLDKDQSLLFVTHNLDFVERFSDKVVVLHYGAFKGLYKTEDFFKSDDPYIKYIATMGC